MEEKPEAKILKTIREYNLVTEGDKIFVGFSGGADSCTLLHFLNAYKAELGISVFALHVNHGIRGCEADLDEEYCINFCKELGVQISVIKRDAVTVSKKEKITVEEAGRLIRYDYFEEMAKGSKIAVAHNKNDVAETMLMRFFRGTGIKGLCGIPVMNRNIIRPLLECERSEIESYCEMNAIKYRTDSTNLSEEFTRNKIRNFYIKSIEKDFNPKLVDSMYGMKRVFDAEEDYLEKQADRAYKTHCVNSQNDLVLKQSALGLHNAVLYRVIRRCLSELSDSRDISRKHVELIHELFLNNTGKKLNLPRNIICEKNYDGVKMCNGDKFGAERWEVPLIIDKTVFIPQADMYFRASSEKIEPDSLKNFFCGAFDYEKINSLSVRNRRNGDIIYFEKVGTKKLKDYFIDKKVERGDRDNMALVCSGKDVLATGDGIFNEKYKPLENTKKIIYIGGWRNEYEKEH